MTVFDKNNEWSEYFHVLSHILHGSTEKKNRQSQNCPPTTHQVGVRWITECFVQELEDLRSEGDEARRQSQTQYDEVGEVLGKYKNQKII